MGCALAALVALRRRGQESRRRVEQGRFAETMQVARSEDEAHQMLKRHVELAVHGATATVLRGNNSANRLEATTELSAGDPLAVAVESAAPDACLAIRPGRVHGSEDPAARLLRCDVWGRSGRSTCAPTLVGGEVIGAVHVGHPDPLVADQREILVQSVGQAAPVLANLRTLAVAEQRAATDALTGLPNSRTAHETLLRMVAHAERSGEGLGVVLLDLDHFKAVNDTFGHAKGDEVLAAVGALGTTQVRASDVLARLGGEEFVVLLPGTERAGAVEVAEKLREAVRAIRVQGVNRPLTASFGVAVLPDDGHEPDALLRAADRALYTAKRSGRDQVCVAEPPGASPAQARG